MPKKTCETCGWWTPKPYEYDTAQNNMSTELEHHIIYGGLCGNRDKFIHGYNLPHLSFKEDCITFCLEMQTKSLYYTGSKFGCVHWKKKISSEEFAKRAQPNVIIKKGEGK